MQTIKALDLNHENPLSKEDVDVDISSSSSDPPDTSNTEWNHITKLGMHDVLLGRGGGTNNHEGNVLFRKLVNEHKMRYLACSKVDKPKVAREVVQLWRKMNPPGRFLNRKDETKRGPGSVKDADNKWFEVGDKKAREKASQCLRERTAEVIPYMKQLREHQDAATEHGVSMVPQQLQMHNNQIQQADNNHILNGNSNHNQGQGGMNGNGNNNNNNNQGQGMNNSNHMNNSFNQGMNNMIPYSHPPGVSVAPVPAFPRRNSQPAPPVSPQQVVGGSCIPQQQPYMGRRGSLPNSAPQGQQLQQQTSPYLARRASLGVAPYNMMASSTGGVVNGGGVALDEFYANTAPPLGGSGGMGADEFYGDMSDLEYEQMIIMQRQHLQMQHMQIQRMRQQRSRSSGEIGARRPSGGGGIMPGLASSMGGSMDALPTMAPGFDVSPRSGNGNHLQGTSYQQQQLSLLYPSQQQQQQQNHHVHFSQDQQLLSLQDPLLYMANQTRTKSPVRNSNQTSASIGAAARAGSLAAVAATTVSPRSTKRTDRSVDDSDYQIGVTTPSPASLSGSRRGRGRGRTSGDAPPDVAPSSSAAFPLAATTANIDDLDGAPQDGELTLEEYRQQLEAYMSNNQVTNAQLEHDDDDHLDSPSDLEDDWEKERDRAFKKEKKRGVGRNVSGISYMSTKTDNSNGMSLVSGMSMFATDLMSTGTTTRENKMNMTRSVCSNLSLMSELTDLSQNIDDLHLFDE